MGKANPFRPIALVVEDDLYQRELVVTLLEESEMSVIQCQSAEEALCVLEQTGGRVSLMFTDINLAGRIDGVELAHLAKRQYPDIHVIVTSGFALTRSLPEGATFMPKPWLPLECRSRGWCCNWDSIRPTTALRDHRAPNHRSTTAPQ